MHPSSNGLLVSTVRYKVEFALTSSLILLFVRSAAWEMIPRASVNKKNHKTDQIAQMPLLSSLCFATGSIIFILLVQFYNYFTIT